MAPSDTIVGVLPSPPVDDLPEAVAEIAPAVSTRRALRMLLEARALWTRIRELESEAAQRRMELANLVGQNAAELSAGLAHEDCTALLAALGESVR